MRKVGNASESTRANHAHDSRQCVARDTQKHSRCSHILSMIAVEVSSRSEWVRSMGLKQCEVSCELRLCDEGLCLRSFVGGKRLKITQRGRIP
jgi:hypothetical protein